MLRARGAQVVERLCEFIDLVRSDELIILYNHRQSQISGAGYDPNSQFYQAGVIRTGLLPRVVPSRPMPNSAAPDCFGRRAAGVGAGDGLSDDHLRFLSLIHISE